MFIFSYNNPFELVIGHVKYFDIIEYHAFKIRHHTYTYLLKLIFPFGSAIIVCHRAFKLSLLFHEYFSLYSRRGRIW